MIISAFSFLYSFLILSFRKHHLGSKTFDVHKKTDDEKKLMMSEPPPSPTSAKMNKRSII